MAIKKGKKYVSLLANNIIFYIKKIPINLPKKPARTNKYIQ